MKKIKICGHRGFFEKYPQNTLPSFGAALEPGCGRIGYDRQQPGTGPGGTGPETTGGTES